MAHAETGVIGEIRPFFEFDVIFGGLRSRCNLTKAMS